MFVSDQLGSVEYLTPGENNEVVQILLQQPPPLIGVGVQFQTDQLHTTAGTFKEISQQLQTTQYQTEQHHRVPHLTSLICVEIFAVKNNILRCFMRNSKFQLQLSSAGGRKKGDLGKSIIGPQWPPIKHLVKHTHTHTSSRPFSFFHIALILAPKVILEYL